MLREKSDGFEDYAGQQGGRGGLQYFLAQERHHPQTRKSADFEQRGTGEASGKEVYVGNEEIESGGGCFGGSYGQ